MRSIRLLAVAIGALVLGSACGDGGGVEPNNNPPVAIFTAPTCTVGVACAFTANPSTDDKAVTGWAWDFNGDATADFTTKDASFTFAAAGSVPVRLIVSDAEGLADTVTNNATVNPATPTNQLPTASFVLPTDCVAGTPCGFQSTSTDPEDGTIADAATDWTFGDVGGVGEGTDVTHTYEAAGTYTVTLTVTDIAGGTATANQPLVVTAPASQDCTTSGTLVDCTLTVTQAGAVKIVVVSEACELAGNKLTVNIPGQAEQTAFFNLCNATVGGEYIVKDATGVTPRVFAAGETLPLRFHQGPQGTNPPVSDPGIRVTGNYASGLNLNIDDGGAAGTPGEPDFNDVVLRVQKN